MNGAICMHANMKRDIVAGLDASQMDEETLWTETQKYYPYAEQEGELHLD